MNDEISARNKAPIFIKDPSRGGGYAVDLLHRIEIKNDLSACYKFPQTHTGGATTKSKVTRNTKTRSKPNGKVL